MLALPFQFVKYLSATQTLAGPHRSHLLASLSPLSTGLCGWVCTGVHAFVDTCMGRAEMDAVCVFFKYSSSNLGGYRAAHWIQNSSVKLGGWPVSLRDSPVSILSALELQTLHSALLTCECMNSGPKVFVASTLPIEPSPGPSSSFCSLLCVRGRSLNVKAFTLCGKGVWWSKLEINNEIQCLLLSLKVCLHLSMSSKNWYHRRWH